MKTTFPEYQWANTMVSKIKNNLPFLNENQMDPCFADDLPAQITLDQHKTLSKLLCITIKLRKKKKSLGLKPLFAYLKIKHTLLFETGNWKDFIYVDGHRLKK